MNPSTRDPRPAPSRRERPHRGRTTFLVGRRTAATSEVHWVRPDPSVFPGPWDLRAVVRTGPASRPQPSDRPTP